MEPRDFARHLRRNQTPAERLMWGILRNRQMGFKFLRQVPRGPYVLDFYCAARKLVIEVDGSQHADSEADAVRDAWLMGQGLQVVRFWNGEVLNHLDGVRVAVEAALRGSPHSPSRSP